LLVGYSVVTEAPPHGSVPRSLFQLRHIGALVLWAQSSSRHMPGMGVISTTSMKPSGIMK
jgi:hypothetical protein